MVDLEDRWFSAAWNGEFAKMPPLELRQLRHPDATGNQGNLEVWVEMYEAGDEVLKPTPIFAPPVIDVEMRVVVFKARNIVNKDIGGQNDLFFKVGLVGGGSQADAVRVDAEHRHVPLPQMARGRSTTDWCTDSPSR